MVDPLFLNRNVTTEWHLEQAKRLHRMALEEASSTALVYAALEARNAIERLVFEMSVLATGGQFTDEQLRMTRRQHGMYQLLVSAMEDYRKHIEFQNLLLRASRDTLQFPIPDIRRCKRLTTELSDYCHCQLDGSETVENSSGHWFIKGISLVEDACDFLEELIRGPLGSVHVASMPPEVKQAYDSFLAGGSDESSILTRLQLMLPVLEQRSKWWRQ